MDEDVFGDELGLSECFTAHSGAAGAQTPIDPPAAVRVSKPQVQRDVVGDELREVRLALVATYDLTVDSRKFALGQILARSLDDCDRDLLTMPAEDAALLRKADTSNTVDFWSGKGSAHGGYRHRSTSYLAAWEWPQRVRTPRERCIAKWRTSHWVVRLTKEMCRGLLLFQQCTGVVCLAMQA